MALTVVCTEAERAAIVGRATRLVVPGEPTNIGMQDGIVSGECWQPGCPFYGKPAGTGCASHAAIEGAIAPGKVGRLVGTGEGDPHLATVSRRFLTTPPQRWVDATGPCETCGGKGFWFNADRTCPSCEGTGRKRVALAVTCPNRHAMRGGWSDCVRCDEHGQVVFAHATVEVLPVVDALEACRPRACLGYPHCDGVQCTALLVTRGPCWLNLNGVAHRLTFDPLPVPGRDFVVLLDNVEMT